MLKGLFLALVAVVVLVGCAGDESSVVPSPYMGIYEGVWVSKTDANDRGSSEWTVDGAGNVEGEDFDPTNEILYRVQGRIENGQLMATATPNNGDAAASLSGPFGFNAVGQLTGDLVWGVTPPLTYNYLLNPKR